MFTQKFDEWMHRNIVEAESVRRREILEKGLGHGTIELLKDIWFPTIGHFDHLYPEWEVRDMSNRYRYLDLAYRPPVDQKGGIEIQGYGSHARDLDVTRFKDLCMRHSLLALDGWTFLPIAYLSIKEEPDICKQLILSFVGKFLSTSVLDDLDWLEAEAVRYARRILRPFTASDLAAHLRITERHARRVIQKLIELEQLRVVSGNVRYRTFQLKF